ncbi:hypothetical protein C0J45_21413 [Silurus meridionalis]|nr:hypothetical protein C0J45_21413 [Silurus meridionalis]
MGMIGSALCVEDIEVVPPSDRESGSYSWSSGESLLGRSLSPPGDPMVARKTMETRFVDLPGDTDSFDLFFLEIQALVGLLNSLDSEGDALTIQQTGKPCLSQTAKDGTVWVEEDNGMASAVANHSCFTAQAGPTESAKYIATKPDKFGIKFWMDLETKYVWGPLPSKEMHCSHQKGERLAENVVMNLIEPFLDDGRNVTTDNFFTSLSLSHRLLQRKTTLLGMENNVRS